MKKYLMTGMAAVLFCGAFTSCSHDDITSAEDISKAQAEQITKTYETAFLKYVGGEIDKNQTWGFSSVASARTRGSNDNKNQWGNPNYGNWQIPPALSEGQILRVKTYFQQNPNLTFEAPTYTTYFVQQVYKGYDDPNTAFSKEIYKSADPNVQDIVGSNHMDKLTVSASNVHVDNFNYGTYNNGYQLKVLNTGATDENDSANYHKDMITLIEDVRPTCVGFNESDGDYQHNDHAALVSASTIDTWIEAKYGASFGAKCVDGWDRDFVGLDYEAKPATEIYLTENGQTRYAKISDYDMGKQLVKIGGKFYKYDDVKDNFLLTSQGDKIPVVSTNKNQYLGEYVKIDQNDLVTKYSYDDIYNSLTEAERAGLTINNDNDVLDIDKILTVATGCVAAVNNDKGGFVKNFGGRDYYFSDWIVTLTPAKKQNTTPTPPTPPTPSDADLRIMAEDLSASDDTDFDFNDIVFDVYFDKTNSGQTKIVVQAAGGTLPLRIWTNKEGDPYQEVHALWSGIEGISTGTMINTGAEAMYGFPRGADNRGTREVTLYYSVNSNAAANNIKIEVQKTTSTGTEWIEMKAVQGEPAAKFAVPATYEWMPERTSIKSKVQTFVDWCQHNSQLIWY